MTVATLDRKVRYTTDGVTTQFPFTFFVSDAAAVKAITIDANDVETPYTDFSLVLSTVGGTLTTGTALNNVDLLIFRETNLTQNTRYPEGTDFPAASHEAALDKLTAISQEIEEALARSPRLMESYIGPLPLLMKSPEAGMYLRWNEAGSGLDNVGAPAVILDAEQVGTLTDIKGDSELSEGSILLTLGYSAIGDGGANYYQIVAAGTGTHDDGSYIDLPASGLQAKGLFLKSDIDVAQFGAGLGLGDDSPRIRACYDFANNLTGIDTAQEITSITGYSKNFVINSPLTLGNTTAVAISKIHIDGAFSCDPSLPFAIKLRGFKSPDIKLGRINPSGGVSVNKGLIIENTFYGKIWCSRIGNYRVPVNYNGDASYGFGGCAYYHFRCDQAGGNDTDYVIEYTAVNGIGYVNSTYTTINGARGTVFSKHTKGAAQTDPYNQNVYEFGGLEAITDIGFDWEFTRFNTVIFPRIENVPSVGIINEAIDCFGNEFNLFTARENTLGTLSTDSIVNGSILDTGGSVRYKQYAATPDGNILHGERVNSADAPNLTVFTNGLTGAEDNGNPLRRYRGFFKDGNGVVHPYGLGTPFSVKRITSYTANDIISVDYATTIDVTVDSGALSLRSHVDREFEGFEIILNIRQGMSNMTFASSDGSYPIASSAFSTAGTYLLKRMDFAWWVTRIGQFVKS